MSILGKSTLCNISVNYTHDYCAIRASETGSVKSPSSDNNREISKIDDGTTTVIPYAHVLLLTVARINGDGGRLEARREQAHRAEHCEDTNQRDRQGCGEECGQSQNCDAGSREEECTNALHDPNLSVQTNVALLCAACKRMHTAYLLAIVTKG